MAAPPRKKRSTGGLASSAVASTAFDAITVASTSSGSSLTGSEPLRRSSRLALAAGDKPRPSAGRRTIRTVDVIDLTSPPSQRKSTRAPRPLTPADSRAEDWSGSSGGSPEFISAGDPLDLTKTVEDVAHSSSRPTIVPLRPETVSLDLSSPVSVNGRSLWQGDVLACCCEMGPDATWEVEGYGGLIATVSKMVRDDEDTSFNMNLFVEDINGDGFVYDLKIVFGNVSNYPLTYDTLITVTTPNVQIRRSHQRAFARLSTVYDISVRTFVHRLVEALQGNEDIGGGVAPDSNTDDEPVGAGEDDAFESLGQPARGFEVAKGSEKDLGRDWDRVKSDFLQAKEMGYRPGLTQISDYWVVSYSIPLKNMPIDPNELCIWDEDLLKAWQEDQRFTLLIQVDRYGVAFDKMKWSLTFDRDYKPSSQIMTSLTGLRNQRTVQDAPRTFFLSDALASHLITFPRSFQLRTTYPLNWDTADKFGMDVMAAERIFQNQEAPVNEGSPPDRNDPIERGWQANLPLCAFYWVCRRFVGAPRYCLNCGESVKVVGRRPYVCDKPLCLYGMMSLGLGPSLPHTIMTHPGVVDLLLSFAHAAAGSTTRMALPLGINIDVPATPNVCTKSTLLDDLDEPKQRLALVSLIECLPKVTEIQAHLKSGQPISKIKASPGAITVLRWVVGSCRAYLKEGRPGEGVVSDSSTPAPSQAAYYGGSMSSSNIRQFSFVVGNPEQETNFAKEISDASATKKSLDQHPTMLVFHGSSVDRWHNIVRTGLDFQETVCGRAYGHGVYFAADSSTSMGTYAKAATTQRPNADLKIVRATALVELVNVPETFVSRRPYYVVDKIKQIKPFLLLVETTPPHPPAPADEDRVAAGMTTEETKKESEEMKRIPSGELFKHDPSLSLQPTYFGRPLQVRMPERVSPATFVDNQPDHPSDAALYAACSQEGSASAKVTKATYTPYPASFYSKVTLLPPPSGTSRQATKALMRELKAVMAAQDEGILPFWLVPDSDRLYSWTLEMFDFDQDSHLAREMKQLKIPAIVAEVRFPASFPVSPPFMRIIHPRCLPFMQGGGGNITAGGSICNEILTASGWNPTYCVEAMVRDIMLNMTAADRPARIDMRQWQTAYGIQEAVEAYKRVAGQHGWEVPKDFDKNTMT